MEEKQYEEIKEKLINSDVTFIAELVRLYGIDIELQDCIAALVTADLLKYADYEGAKERWGLRFKKSELLSLIMQTINGMARRIDELESESNTKTEVK
jgi:hypothetical protein